MDKETARIEAFSDGVFAVAITLLVLEIKVPTAGEASLTSLLLKQWASYVSFLVSFAFIGVMWTNHHRLFTHIRRSTDTLLALNLLLLLGVTAVPFPTAVLAQYLGHRDQRIAALLYNATYFVIAIIFNVLWRYSAWNNRLLSKDADASAVDRISKQYALGPVLYLVCLALAWISVPLSLLLNLALAIFFAVPPRIAVRLRKK